MIKSLKDGLEKTGNSELINKNLNTDSSKCIIKAIEGNQVKTICHDNKHITGKYINQRVGIEMCPHFNEWIEK